MQYACGAVRKQFMLNTRCFHGVEQGDELPSPGWLWQGEYHESIKRKICSNEGMAKSRIETSRGAKCRWSATDI